MDNKIVIQACAGSGKTQLIVNETKNQKLKYLIITFTDNNRDNLRERILKSNDNTWPTNVCLITYYSFLFNFCYKPFFSDEIKAKGILFDSDLRPGKYTKKNALPYYLSDKGYFYKARLSTFVIDYCLEDVIKRVEEHFDFLIIDECQDMDSWDFDLILSFKKANVSLLYVGDFYQHTFSTSNDGNKNKNLYENMSKYRARFEREGFLFDDCTLSKSWRCSKSVCSFIEDNLGISIKSNKEQDSNVVFINDEAQVIKILSDSSIAKLHYSNGGLYGKNHFNWGEVKGVDNFEDVCVLLNKKTFLLYKNNNLKSLTGLTKNKLYVAITRAHNNVFLIEEEYLKKLNKT